MAAMVRPEQWIPADVLEALVAGKVINEFNDRPKDQRTKYVEWIGESDGEGERAARASQMVEELREGGVFLGMPHPASRKEHHRQPPEPDQGDPL